MRRAEVLELRAVGPGLLRQCHEAQSALQVTIMIRSDISDEVRGLTRTYASVANREGHHIFTLVRVRVSTRIAQRRD
jgi:hypothetical protein